MRGCGPAPLHKHAGNSSTYSDARPCRARAGLGRPLRSGEREWAVHLAHVAALAGAPQAQLLQGYAGQPRRGALAPAHAALVLAQSATGRRSSRCTQHSAVTAQSAVSTLAAPPRNATLAAPGTLPKNARTSWLGAGLAHQQAPGAGGLHLSAAIPQLLSPFTAIRDKRAGRAPHAQDRACWQAPTRRTRRPLQPVPVALQRPKQCPT